MQDKQERMAGGVCYKDDAGCRHGTRGVNEGDLDAKEAINPREGRRI